MVSYNALLRQQKMLWRQKVHLNWIVAGDANSRFFHCSTLIRQRQNCTMCSVGDTEEEIIESQAICEEVHNYFVQRWGPKLGGVEDGVPEFERRASLAQVEELIHEVSHEEVWEMVKLLPCNKVLGLDRFLGSFFKLFWPGWGRI